MKTKIFLAMIVAVLVIGLTSLVAAEDYTFGLTEVYSFSEKTPNFVECITD